MALNKTICFVTPGHLSHNPRLYKEACAVEEAGYNVRIVANQSLPWVSKYDSLLLNKHPKWDFDSIRWNEKRLTHRLFRIYTGIRQRVSKIGFNLGIKDLANTAFGRVYPELLKRALKRADLFIGHNLAALPAVAKASEDFACPFGFDLEDAYFGEGISEISAISPIVTHLETKYLSRANYVTASSPFIADEYQRRYALKKPTTILNVFPWKNRELLKAEKAYKDRKDPKRISFYWYSQTTGLDRGIQDIIKALIALDNPLIELHLRGSCSEAVKSALLAPANNHPISRHIYFHSQVDPDELLVRTAEHDIGLALENGETLNRNLCITNKIFFYMLSGLGIIATATQGQSWIMKQCPQAGFLYDPGNIKALSLQLLKIVSNRNSIELWKQNSLKAAKEKLNWELESQKFLCLVQSLFR